VHRSGFPAAAVRIDGALGIRRTARGLSPQRMPEGATLPDPFLEFDVAAAAGIRLVFRTAATRIRVTVRCEALELPGIRFEAPFDLVIDGEFVARECCPAGTIRFDDDRNRTVVTGADETVEFAGLAAADKLVEIWLPHTAVVELLAIEADAEIVAPPADGRPRWLHHGSSISHCLEATGPTGSWPAIAAARGGRSLIGLGFAGQAVLDPVVARAIRDTPADLISLCIGINIVGGALMRERTFLPAAEGFLETIREGHPETPILIVSPILCPALEEAPGPLENDPVTGRLVALGTADDARRGALTLRRCRELLAELARRGGGPVRYLDGRELFGIDDVGDLPDGLHPNPAGYARMGDRFAHLVFER
jgi:lysophospholipase L1-like esterase